MSIAAVLHPLLTERVSLTVSSLTDVLREVGQGVKLRPQDDNRQWTLAFWHERFQLLASLIERQVNGLVKPKRGKEVACSLFIPLDPSVPESSIARLLNGDAKVHTVVRPYSKEEEGIHRDTDEQIVLTLIGRGRRALERQYPCVCIGVPAQRKYALPGAPELYCRMRRSNQTQEGADESYISNALSFDKWGNGITQDAKNAFTSYFTKHGAQVAAFICVGLVWDGEVVGVLNIDSVTPGFLDDPDDHDIVQSLMHPYAELAAGYAKLFRNNLDRWLTEPVNA